MSRFELSIFWFRRTK